MHSQAKLHSNVLRGTYYAFELDENNKAIKLNGQQIDKENSPITMLRMQQT